MVGTVADPTFYHDLMKNEFKNTPIELAAVRGGVLRMVGESTSRVAPPELEKWLVEHHGLKKKEAKKVLKELVSEGELAYTYEFGTSFLELSFNRPVRVSTRVVLKPPGLHFEPQAEDVVITIRPGAAFGDGRHPTSRLAVRGIEYVLKETKPVWNKGATTVLDIGTGSGILVITAVQMGIHSGLGIDIDPSARAEATENVLLNRLGDRVEISDQSIETIDGKFNLITANLRYPTLKKMSTILQKITRSEGVVVCSGIRSHELTDLINIYKEIGFELAWQEQSLEWGGVAFSK
jgi:ribosomal protein L11 methyltransferase